MTSKNTIVEEYQKIAVLSETVYFSIFAMEIFRFFKERV